MRSLGKVIEVTETRKNQLATDQYDGSVTRSWREDEIKEWTIEEYKE